MSFNWGTDWSSYPAEKVNNLTVGEMAAVIQMFRFAYAERAEAVNAASLTPDWPGGFDTSTPPELDPVAILAHIDQPLPWSATDPVKTYVLTWWRNFFDQVYNTGKCFIEEAEGIPLDFTGYNWIPTISQKLVPDTLKGQVPSGLAFFPRAGIIRKWRNTIANLRKPPFPGREMLTAKLTTRISNPIEIPAADLAPYNVNYPDEDKLRLTVFAWDTGTSTWVAQPRATTADIVTVDSADWIDFYGPDLVGDPPWTDGQGSYIQRFDFFGGHHLENIKRMIEEMTAFAACARIYAGPGALSFDIFAPHLVNLNAGGETPHVGALGVEMTPSSVTQANDGIDGYSLWEVANSSVIREGQDADSSVAQAAADEASLLSGSGAYEGPGTVDFYGNPDGTGSVTGEIDGALPTLVQETQDAITYDPALDVNVYYARRFAERFFLSTVNFDGTRVVALASMTAYVRRSVLDDDSDPATEQVGLWSVLGERAEGRYSSPQYWEVDPGDAVGYFSPPPDYTAGPPATHNGFVQEVVWSCCVVFSFNGLNGFRYRRGYTGT